METSDDFLGKLLTELEKWISFSKRAEKKKSKHDYTSRGGYGTYVAQERLCHFDSHNSWGGGGCGRRKKCAACRWCRWLLCDDGISTRTWRRAVSFDTTSHKRLWQNLPLFFLFCWFYWWEHFREGDYFTAAWRMDLILCSRNILSIAMLFDLVVWFRPAFCLTMLAWL